MTGALPSPLIWIYYLPQFTQILAWESKLVKKKERDIIMKNGSVNMMLGSRTILFWEGIQTDIVLGLNRRFSFKCARCFLL